MSAPAPASPPPAKKTSLLTLLALVAFLAVGLFFAYRPALRAYGEYSVDSTVAASGGTSERSQEFWRIRAGKEFDDDDLASIAAHLAQLDPAVDRVALILDDSKITDVGAAHLARIAALEEVHFVNCSITDAGAKHLAGCNRLAIVTLNHTQVTLAGLEAMKNKPALIELWVTGLDIDRGAAAALIRPTANKNFGVFQ